MCPDAPFLILFCLTPDDFTHQGETSQMKNNNAHEIFD